MEKVNAKDFLGKDDDGNSRCDRVYSSENTKVPTVLQVYPSNENIQSWFKSDNQDNKFEVSFSFRINSFSCNIASFPSGPQLPVYPPVSNEVNP